MNGLLCVEGQAGLSLSPPMVAQRQTNALKSCAVTARLCVGFFFFFYKVFSRKKENWGEERSKQILVPKRDSRLEKGGFPRVSCQPVRPGNGHPILGKEPLVKLLVRYGGNAHPQPCCLIGYSITSYYKFLG